MIDLDGNKVYLTELYTIITSRFKSDKAAILLLQLLIWKKMSINLNIDNKLSFNSFFNNIKISWNMLEEIFLQLRKNNNNNNDEFSFDFSPEIMENESNLDLIKLINLLNSKDIEIKSYEQVYQIYEVLFIKSYDYYTPIAICELISNLAKLVEAETIYNPFSGDLLLAMVVFDVTKCAVFGESPNYSLFAMLIKSLTDFNIEVINSDPVNNPSYKEKEHILRKFDISISVPPFNLVNTVDLERDVFQRFKYSKKSKYFHSHLIEHMIAQTKKKVILLGSNNFLFSSSDMTFRKYLVDEGYLEGIITLPGGIFHHTSIQSHILILNLENKSEKVRFVDSSKIFVGNNKTSILNTKLFIEKIIQVYKNKYEHINNDGDDSFYTSVSVDVIQKNNYSFSPSDYIFSKDSRQARGLLNKFERVPLIHVCNTFRSQRIAEALNETDVVICREVTSKDVPECGFISTADKELRLERDSIKSFNRYKLEPFDVLLTAKGFGEHVGIIFKDLKDSWIANQNFQVFRFNDGDKEEQAILLYMFLKSDIGNTLLKSYKKGTAIPHIQINDLKNLEIPVLSEKQRKIVVENFHKKNKLKEELEKIKKDIVLIDSNYLNFEEL